MMFSVNDLKNVNSFVKDARADSPAGSSTMSSASLSGPAAYQDGLKQQEKQTGEPWFRWRRVGSITQGALAPQGNKNPIAPAQPPFSPARRPVLGALHQLLG